MPSVDYIYPNVTEISRRGGLLERWCLAEQLRCTYVEIPGDFIKNKTEVERTGQDIGSILTRSSIEKLYQHEAGLPYTLRYSLHAEPGIPRRRDRHGRQIKAELRWRDPEWVITFGDMLLEIGDFLGVPPDIIEVHPGSQKNTYADIATGIHTLIIAHQSAFGVEPRVLLENHRDQRVATGKQIQGFWRTLINSHPEIRALSGIALDPKHLHTVTREDFTQSLKIIPPEALKGIHIHTDLRSPSVTDKVPWREVFAAIRDLPDRPYIKPAVYQKNRVAETIEFCENMLSAPSEEHKGPVT